MPILNMIYWATWWGGWWWQPWVNPIFYIPLNQDITDYSLTPKTLSWTWTANYSLISWTKYGARFSAWSINLPASAFSSIWDETLSFWANVSSWQNDKMMCDQDTWNNDNLSFRVYTSSWDLSFRAFGVNSGAWINFTQPSANAWHHYVMTRNATTWEVIVYCDNVLKWNWTGNTWTFSSNNKGQLWSVWDGSSSYRFTNLTMWDFILENRVRTAQEIADYYNQTKWDYWIS